MEPTYRELKMARLQRECMKCYNIEMAEWLWCECTDWRTKPQLYKSYLALLKTHDMDTHEDKEITQHHIGNGKPNGIFAGTLTMSPKDALNENDMLHAINKIMIQKTVPVEKYAWYLEYTDANVPHIHFIYRTTSGGRIHQKIFKRYWKIWDESQQCGKGHRGGYHKVVESETAYTEYIEKDGGRHINKWTN